MVNKLEHLGVLEPYYFPGVGEDQQMHLKGERKVDLHLSGDIKNGCTLLLFVYYLFPLQESGQRYLNYSVSVFPKSFAGKDG